MFKTSKEIFYNMIPPPIRRSYDVNNVFFDEGNVII